jgi:hypothetical protein
MFKIFLVTSAGWCIWHECGAAGEALGFVNQNKRNAKNAGGRLVVAQKGRDLRRGRLVVVWNEVELGGELSSPVITQVKGNEWCDARKFFVASV